MHFRRRITLKYFFFTLFLIVIYNEFFVYILQQMHWNEMECQGGDATCTKVLLIADPQIQGDLAVPPPLSYLFNWDSDRYLQKTFSAVVRHLKPDMLIYLGDMMDEGSISTREQYHNYVRRLSDIFEMDYSVVQVWVPGDNDIGGENEPIRKDKIKEFGEVFKQPDVVSFRNISVYKVNKISHTLPELPDDNSHENNFKIVVSHYPLIVGASIFAQKFHNDIKPDLYFCGHDHEAKYVTAMKDSLSDRQLKHMSYGDSVLNVHFEGDTVHEIYVPTCSYRMGTSKIGYGVAILENNNQRMRYTVFWSSTRFPFLVCYLIILVIVTVYSAVFLVSKCIFRRHIA